VHPASGQARAGILILAVLGALLIGPLMSASSQEVIDKSFHPDIARPAYASGTGPVVAVDRGHHDFYEPDDAFAQLAEILERDGYRVRSLRADVTAAALSDVQVLVVVNALADRDVDRWELPTSPAFRADEVTVVANWVRGGGSLLLVADHMPFPGAAAALGRAMGVEFMNGFAIVEADWDPFLFRRADNGLRAHPITDGRSADERVDSVVTFVSGQAFRALDSRVRPLLVLGKDVVSINMQKAWEYTDATPRVNVEGWLQGAAVDLDAGRAAVFGEAAMFSAQLVGPKRNPVGMNAPAAGQNLQLLLNTMHWLSRAE